MRTRGKKEKNQRTSRTVWHPVKRRKKKAKIGVGGTGGKRAGEVHRGKRGQGWERDWPGGGS